METLILPRGKGKTYELIKRSSSDGGEIVCQNKVEVLRVKHEAREMGVKIPNPITYDEFINHKYRGRNIKEFYIDNVDIFIQTLSHIPIGIISLTTQE